MFAGIFGVFHVTGDCTTLKPHTELINKHIIYIYPQKTIPKSLKQPIIWQNLPYNPSPLLDSRDVQEVAPLGHITSEASGVENSTGSKAGLGFTNLVWHRGFGILMCIDLVGDWNHGFYDFPG